MFELFNLTKKKIKKKKKRKKNQFQLFNKMLLI